MTCIRLIAYVGANLSERMQLHPRRHGVRSREGKGLNAECYGACACDTVDCHAANFPDGRTHRDEM